jgi:predicted HAD superfamily Cof-like phosphohydrolase
MRVEQEKVQLFHEKNGIPCAERPTLVSRELSDLRYRIMREELDEYQEAVAAEDLAGIADALGDLAYTVLGSAVTHGINLQPIFDEIHRSNMTKEALDPVTKKGGKGPSYEPPRIAELLIMQTAFGGAQV